jgi:hypothetical protein
VKRKPKTAPKRKPKARARRRRVWTLRERADFFEEESTRLHNELVTLDEKLSRYRQVVQGAVLALPRGSPVRAAAVKLVGEQSARRADNRLIMPAYSVR